MRTINGVTCWTEYASPGKRVRHVYVLGYKKIGRKQIGTIKRCNDGFNFEIEWWLFESQQPMHGRRTTMKECLKTIVEQWKDHLNRN